MTQLVLSLFPGIGLLDMAFEEEGFCVVRGPDLLWGGDIRRFHPPAGKFAGVIGGPPCQEFTVANNMNKACGVAPSIANLIPEFERCVAAAGPDWFLMENVPRAPLPSVAGYEVDAVLINNRWLGEEQNRERRFSFGSAVLRRLQVQFATFESMDFHYAASTGGGHRPKRERQKQHLASLGVNSRHSEAAFRHFVEIQGLPAGFELPGFTAIGKCKAIANGVPLAMGRAVAKAVRASLSGGQEKGAA